MAHKTQKVTVNFNKAMKFFFGETYAVSPLEYGIVATVLTTAALTAFLALTHAQPSVADVQPNSVEYVQAAD